MEKENHILRYVMEGLLFLVGVAIIWLFIDARRDKQDKNVSSKDTIVVLAKQAVIHNYNFTNPTLFKEKTIEYHTGEVLTRQDSNAIIFDYLKERIYSDSVYNDTSKVVYRATVAKNALMDIFFTHSYKPKIYTVTQNKYRNSIFLGGAGGWFQNTPTFGFYAGIETRRFQIGTLYDPLKNPQGGYIILSKRINFK